MKVARSIWRAGGSAVGVVVVACIAVAVNVILGSLNWRADLTEEKLYALSGGTKAVVGKLENTVTLKFFFSSSSPEVPVQLKNYAQRVEDLLVEYELAGGGRVRIEKFDPKPDSDAEDWAKRYGVQGQAVGFMGPMLYLGLVAATGDSEDVLPVLDPRAEDTLEYSITRMISRVANPKKPVVGVMSALPVMGRQAPPYPMPGQPPPQPQPAWFAFADLQRDYDVRTLDPSDESIAEDIDALVLVHPKNLAPKTLFAIDQFVLRGGRLIAFLDPLCITEAELNPAPPQMRFQASYASNLEGLLDAWGVTYDPGKVVADLEAQSRLRGADNRIEENPVWLSLNQRHLDGEDILTSHIESVMLPFSGAFSVAAAAGLEVSTLMSSSETSALMDAMTAQFGGEGLRRQFRSSMTRHALAVRLHGKLKTAFPDGAPKDEPADEAGGEDAADEADAADVAGTGLKESTDKSTVLLVGDVDMLYDRFCVQEVNFFGQRGHQPMNDNLAFLANAIEQAAGSSALIGIRTRGRSVRPFEVVQDLQRQAQERYLAEEGMLQQKLEEVQRRLGELQQRKDHSQEFIISADQQREIKKFRDQQYETQQQLKLVRRRLREDIERLGAKIKTVNILLMPLCVALSGIGFGVYRRRRTKG